MSKALRLLLPFACGAITALGLLSCHTGRPAQEPPVSPAPAARAEEPAREEALAMVDELQLKTHEEFLDNGDVIVSNMVGFSILRPEHHDRIFVHTQSLPMIGFRRLQLGDTVYFELPDPRWGTDLDLSQLRGLRFADLRGEGSGTVPYTDFAKAPSRDQEPWQGRPVAEALTAGAVSHVVLLRAETTATTYDTVVKLQEVLAGAKVFEKLPDGRAPAHFPAVWEEVIETSDGRSLLLRADAEWACLFSMEGHGCFRVPS